MGAMILDQMAAELLAYAERTDHDDLSHLIRALDGVQDLWRSNVRLEDIPPPTDADPRILALSACVLERLVEVWRTPPHDRYDERAPSWCAEVAALREPLWLIDQDQVQHGLNPIFKKRNVMVLLNFSMFA